MTIIYKTADFHIEKITHTFSLVNNAEIAVQEITLERGGRYMAAQISVIGKDDLDFRSVITPYIGEYKVETVELIDPIPFGTNINSVSLVIEMLPSMLSTLEVTVEALIWIAD